MISVMHILSDSNIGGAGRYVADMTAVLDPERFQVLVVVPPGARIVSLLAPGIEVVELPGMIADASYSRSSVQALSALIRTRQPDVVHTHGSLAGRIAARINQVKVVYTRHTAGESFRPRSPKWHLGRWMNRGLADRVIAVSGHMAEVLKKEGIPEAMIQVLHNGINLSRFNPGDYDIQQLKAEQGLEERLICAVVARLEPVKGHRYMLEAWAQIQSTTAVVGGNPAESGAEPPTARNGPAMDGENPAVAGKTAGVPENAPAVAGKTLTVAGKDPDAAGIAAGSPEPSVPGSASAGRPRIHLLLIGDGSLRAELAQQVQKAGLADSVTFIGEVSEVRPWLAMADIVALPSLTEGLPIALVEAMAMGKPCVASRAGGIPEVITDELDGLLVPPAEPGALADALQRLVASPQLRQRLGLAARQTVEQRFDIRLLAQECGRIYQSVTGKI